MLRPYSAFGRKESKFTGYETANELDLHNAVHIEVIAKSIARISDWISFWSIFAVLSSVAYLFYIIVSMTAGDLPPLGSPHKVG